jgi:hypothetical protein
MANHRHCYSPPPASRSEVVGRGAHCARLRDPDSSLRAQRSNPSRNRKKEWIASSHPPSPEGGLRRTRGLLARTLRHDSAISPHAFLREVFFYLRPSNKGRRESRALDAPAASRTIKNKVHEHIHHRFTGTTRPSLRDGLAAVPCSPRCIGLVGHRHPRALTRT